MIGPRQTVHPQHAEYSSERGYQYCALKSDRNKRGPWNVRPTAHVHGILTNIDPGLKPKSSDTSDKTAKKYHPRNPIVLKPRRLRQAMNRERRIRIDLVVSGLTDLVRRHDYLFGIGKLRQRAIYS